MWFKGLVAVTCLAVLAAIGWWGWGQYQAALPTRESCLAALRTWVEEKRTGAFDGYLAKCREIDLIRLSDVGDLITDD